MNRALFLAPEAPYPLTGGGTLRSASLLERLARDYTVDAVIFHTPGQRIELPPGLVDKLFSIELAHHSKDATARLIRNAERLLRRIPPLIDRFSGSGAAITGFVNGRPPYDLAVVEHFWCAPYWEQIGPRARRTILDLHNIESVWHLACRKVAQWPHSLAHDVFRRAALDLERRWLPRYSLLLATSATDAERIRQIAPGLRVAIYPNTIPLIEPPRGEKQEAIVFSGTLEYEPNLTAVRYFAREVWPVLRRQWPDLTWRLVGRNPESVEKYVGGDPRIERTGPVEDAMPHIAAARVAVVPLLSGSGTRLKIIEAWAAGVPVVSTSLGAEGLPVCHGENILLADGARAFAAAVSRLLSSGEERERIAVAGRSLYEREFTWDTAWKALDTELEKFK